MEEQNATIKSTEPMEHQLEVRHFKKKINKETGKEYMEEVK